MIKAIYRTSFTCEVDQASKETVKNGEQMDFFEFPSFDEDDSATEAENVKQNPPAFVPGSPYLDSVKDVWAIEDLYIDVDFDETFVARDKYELLSWATAQLCLSPSASIMLQEAMEDGWCVGIEDLSGPDFHLDVPEKMIVLDDNGMLLSALARSEYFRNMLLVSYIRALRDVWQEKRHGGFDEEYAPENILMLERVRAADLDVLAVFCGWELRGEGHGSLWRHLIGSEDGDIAMRFSGYLERDPSSLFNGQALAAAFSQWFRDIRRVSTCEHEVMNDLDIIMAEREDADMVFGNERLTRIKLETLSCLPDRTAYLQGKGSEILADPLYAGMQSMVNQAHLMQIIHDIQVTRVQNVPFRDSNLAQKIFPNGLFTPEAEVPVQSE
tara:strand:- start:85 stop:1236 length:1152 start_codon:yes stop_codon:yes gene_type:complete